MDWIRGSLATPLGDHDWDDYQPFNAGADGATYGVQTVSCTSGTPVVALQTDAGGVINLTHAAGANEAIGVVRNIYYDLQTRPVTCIGARFEQNADADSPIAFVGLTDQAGSAVLTAGVVYSASNQDTIGLLWNADETIDIVSCVDGTLAVLKNDIGISVERDSGPVRFELRIEVITPTLTRLTPVINGVTQRQGAVSVVTATYIPANPVKPCVATTVAETTPPSIDIDWILSGQN